jgi:NhaA family Na+:H+ antiporter
MAVPAIIYYYCNSGYAGMPGCGIPMATDIAFTIGVLSLLGKRVPIAIKVFLIALAIVDDLGAIVVMAFFYPTHALSVEFLVAAMVVVGLLITLNSLRVNNSFPYIALGILLWFLILRSGIHATIAGVILAMTIPSRMKINQIRFYVRSKYILDNFKKAYNNAVPLLKNEQEQEQIGNMLREIHKATPLILRIENALHHWITYCIMPIFALANAGVIIHLDTFSMLFANADALRVFGGIFLGLVLGKPIGIVLASFCTIKLGLAAMPDKARWIEMIGAGMLAGIGFTMSIFIDTLAFSTDDMANLQNLGKLSILIASLFAGICGYVFMSFTCKKTT